MQSLITHQGPACFQLAITEMKILELQSQKRPSPSFPANPHLYTKHDIVCDGIFHWPVWILCSGYAASQRQGHLHTSQTLEAGKSLISEQQQKASVCYQHASHTKSHRVSKPKHYSSYSEGK